MNVLREEITFQHFRLSRSAFPLCGMRGEKATARSAGGGGDIKMTTTTTTTTMTTTTITTSTTV